MRAFKQDQASSNQLLPEKISTNQVFIRTTSKEKVWYMPVYIRFRVKSFSQLDIEHLKAEVRGILILTVYYGNSQKKVVQAAKKKIVLNFSQGEALELSSEKSKPNIKFADDEKKKEFTFTVRSQFACRIVSNVFWSPFQILDLIMSLTLLSTTIDKKSKIQFNCMDSDKFDGKITYSNEGSFGNYDLAQKKMSIFYGNSFNYTINSQTNVKQIQMNYDRLETSFTKNLAHQPPIQNFKYVHIDLPLYKHPTSTVATIFLPLWLLTFVSLAIFFQDQNLANRLQSITALLIAFVALITTIREQIPPAPSILLVEIIVYAATVTSLLCTVQSLIIRDQTTFVLDFRTDPLFLISVIISMAGFVTIIILLLLYFCVWKPSYISAKDLQTPKHSTEKFERALWKNSYCDQYFGLLYSKKKQEFEFI